MTTKHQGGRPRGPARMGSRIRCKGCGALFQATFGLTSAEALKLHLRLEPQCRAAYQEKDDG